MSGHASPARRRTTDIWFAIGVIISVALLAWVVVTMQQLGHDLRTANQARDQLAAQVQRLGGKPVAGAPGSRGEPGQSVVGPQGPQGDPGPAGSPGPSGSPGAKGRDGVGKVGPTGATGTDGESVVGPAGPQGEPGPAGRDGADGTDGADGAPGRDGQTCPSGYSLQALPSDPDALVCRREGGTSDPSPASQGFLGLGALASTSTYRRL